MIQQPVQHMGGSAHAYIQTKMIYMHEKDHIVKAARTQNSQFSVPLPTVCDRRYTR